MKYILAFLDLILFIALLPIWLIRALCTKPKRTIAERRESPYTADNDAAVKHLSEAVRIPTISVVRDDQTYEPFVRFHKFIEDTYPNVEKIAEKTKIWDYSLVYRIAGSDSSLKPIALLAHQDVVPASDDWKESTPFSGEIKDGYIYGRGTQDMKGTLIAILEAVETMLKNGYKPQRDVYLMFGHDEEPSTQNGALNICKYFKEKGIEFESILDEGGAMLDGALLGINAVVCMIGTCEKGYMDTKITTEVDGGHASNPGRTTAIDVLSKTILKLRKHPMRSHWTPVVSETFKELAPHMNLLFRLLFANSDVLRPLLMVVLSFIPITNSLISTTFAPTMLKGSDAANVISPDVSAVINSRVLPTEDTKAVLAHIEKIAKSVNDKTKVELIMGNEPTIYCSCKSEQYKTLALSIEQSFDGCISAPFMFMAGTDARYYYPVCSQIYRFTPFFYSMEDTTRIHGRDERCKIDDLEKAINFFMVYVENAAK